MVNVFSSAGFTVQDFSKIIYWSWKKAGGDTTSLQSLTVRNPGGDQDKLGTNRNTKINAGQEN